MDLLRCSAVRFPETHLRRTFRTALGPCFATVRSSLSLPFSEQKAKYYRELEAAVDVVERACRLCIDVKSSLFSDDDRILEKNDQTPVTIADFGVQALVSLEMNKLFPSIPLVAEEDSSFLRSTNLVGAMVDAVANKATFRDEVTEDSVLKAIDRGGKDACSFGPNPATYWVLDPIDGTRGFVKGVEALYVVALALVVEGQIVLRVMGCPNWDEDYFVNCVTGVQETGNNFSRSGMIMVSHVGCGTWKQSLCKYMMLASGRASVFLLRATTRNVMKKISGYAPAWDHAVGIICGHDAGGKVHDQGLMDIFENLRIGWELKFSHHRA
ncbi:hypothetical protein CQW23_04591 [Capsicum baccatum]|uniref:PAP-specific phosphatase, mitochondrial n=1 Tax=Capsicum baccatum TaxID=33114 RepID=A0A2G2XF28_CAPBA|nr:hypothetical protein CQW23_04591 [Capsicum baccatum]